MNEEETEQPDQPTEPETKEDVQMLDLNNKNNDLKTNAFEWKDINVTIEGKQILHNINGRVEGGQLLAILGGSGAGKTTLLNTISGRQLCKTPSTISKLCCIKKCKSFGTQVSGSVAYKGKEFIVGSNDAIKYIGAYVMQHDIMCATSTTIEALEFSSKLRNNTDNNVEIINDIVESLQLSDCINTRIGNDAIRGMSGGEKKRTSVGIELVTSPQLIYLDEPTSGLDSFTALKTLQILKKLTVKNPETSIVATIHQPSSEIFGMIDILVLLAKGYVVYHGKANKVLDYFENNCGYKCPQYVNIADFVVNNIQENSEFFIEKWQQYEKDYIDLNFDSYDVLSPNITQNKSFLTQFLILLKREAKILSRDPRPSKIRFIQTIIFSLFVGILYNQLPYTQEGLRDRFGAIFFLTVNSSMTGLISTIIIFPEQRLLFERERDSNMYKTTTWLFTKFLIGIPEQALFTLIYQLIVYWMVGCDSEFYELYISLLLCVICTGSFGMIIGCFANNAGEAMQLMPMAFIPFLLFTNFLVSLEQIPVWIRWIQWLDPFKYLVDALSITEFNNILKDWDCIVHETTGQEVCDFLYNGNVYLKQIDAGYLNTYWLENFVTTYEKSVVVDWILLFVLVIGFRFITWAILVHRNGW
eukprot:513121_1